MQPHIKTNMGITCPTSTPVVVSPLLTSSICRHKLDNMTLPTELFNLSSLSYRHHLPKFETLFKDYLYILHHMQHILVWGVQHGGGHSRSCHPCRSRWGPPEVHYTLYMWSMQDANIGCCLHATQMSQLRQQALFLDTGRKKHNI